MQNNFWLTFVRTKSGGEIKPVKHSAVAEELCIGEYLNLVVSQITFDLNVRGCYGDIRSLGA